MRAVYVSFYAIEPVPAFEKQQTFPSGQSPGQSAGDNPFLGDPPEETYRIPDNLYGGETLCLLHENGGPGSRGTLVTGMTPLNQQPLQSSYLPHVSSPAPL